MAEKTQTQTKPDDGEEKVAVYLCHCGKNIAGVIDIDKLSDYTKDLDGVVITREYKFMCSTAGQKLIADDLKSGKVDRIVVAACSPLMHEETYRNVLRTEGVNEFQFEQANIREHASWVNLNDHDGALAIAKDHIKMAVAKVIENKALTRLKFPVVQEALVVGAGITGMFTALDLADKYKVHLVERSPTVGGHMAQLDKTFPTMDCSACIITPKMVEVGRHPNINILTNSEIEEVDLTVGSFGIKVRTKAPKINPELCNGCGSCALVCPTTVPNEFDVNLGYRASAYIPFPQAVPETFTIDSETCINCGLCVTACEVKAIDLSVEDKLTDLTVGAVVLATGNDIFDPTPLYRYGYSRYKNVLSGIQMERLLSSTGPTLGHVINPHNHTDPTRIAFVQCVGSRDFHQGAHKYCSRVCCMASMKQARQFKEKHPEAEVSIIYIDIRAFGKGYEEFYEVAAREYGIMFIRGRVGDVYQDPDGTLVVTGSETLIGEKFELKVDMLILAAAIEARKDAGDIGRQFGVQSTDDGFMMESHPKLFPVDSLSTGIFIAGTCQAPRDIPDAVAQAKAAASSADNFLAPKEIEVEPYYCYVLPEICSGCRSCIKVCPFDAISFDEGLHVAEIDIKKCKGCGVCMITCPSCAIEQNHFTNTQILSEINALQPWANYTKEVKH